MKSNTVHPYIHGLWVLTMSASVLLLLAAVPGYLRLDFNQGTIAGASEQLLTTTRIISSAASFSIALLSLVLAVILYVQKRSDRMALFISFYLLVYGIVMGGPFEVISQYWGVLNGMAIPLQTGVLTLPTIIIFSTFPDGRFVPRWTRWLVAATAIVNFSVYLRPIDLWITFSDLPAQILGTLFIIMLFLSMYAQVYRYRNVSGFIARQQTKWVVAGLFLWVLYIGISSVPYVYLQNLPLDEPIPPWAPLASVFWWVSLSIFPLSLAIAILRARLWDIDLLIRRTVSYTLLTGLLAMVYYGGVLLFQNVFGTFMGESDTPLITVVTTLTIAALFNPLRTRIQNLLDRRFYRARYDAEKALIDFAETARDEVDMNVISTRLLSVVAETVQPEELQLLLKTPEKHPSSFRQVLIKNE